MHLSSFEHMGKLVEAYLDPAKPLRVVDIGAYDVNGAYRPHFTGKPSWTYVGADLEAGPNVDLIFPSPYTIPLQDASVDLIVSGQAFEHVEFFWLSWLEMTRILKPGGLIFLIAPSRGPEHRYPQDCWRFYPDAYTALAKYAALDLIEVHTDWTPHPDPDSSLWGDTVGVFRKRPERFGVGILRRLIGWATTRYVARVAG